MCKKDPSTDEEFMNFMTRVNEVSTIVKNLSSRDPEKNELGTKQADEYLKYSDIDTTTIDEERIVTKTKFNKSVFNKQVGEYGDSNSGEMSQEAFMRHVERDADQRYKDKCRRKERADTLKKRGNNAFRQLNYTKALSCYNEAISMIRDSFCLYTNRALTYIQLNKYDKAIEDCEIALKLNENSLKVWLYLVRCYAHTNNHKKYKEAIDEAKKRNPKYVKYIEDYVTDIEKLSLSNNPGKGNSIELNSDEEGNSNNNSDNKNENIIKDNTEIGKNFENLKLKNFEDDIYK